MSSDSLISSSSGSNGITSGPALPKRSLWCPNQVHCPGSSTVSSRQEHTRSELSGGIQGSDHSHRKLRISLHRNPSGDSRGDVDLTNRFWTSHVLHEVPEVSIPPPTATLATERTLSQGLSKPGREYGNAVHGGRNLPTAPRSGIWPPLLSRTTLWLLSDCDLISERSSPQPPTEYCKIDIGKWVSEAVQHPPELLNAVSWQTDQSDVVYLGEFHTKKDSRPSQPAPIYPKLEPGSSNSGSATKKRIPRGREDI